MPDPVPELGKHLYDKIRESGKTVAEIAAMLDVPVTTLKSWLDRNSIPKEELLILAKQFGLPDNEDELGQSFEFRIARSTRRRAPDLLTSDGIVRIDEPLPPNHPAFCMRPSCEEALGRALQAQPFRVGIRGGRKTGKSTAALWLKDKLRVHAPALYFDLRQFRESTADAFFAWLDEQARLELPNTPLSRLTGAHRFTKWVGENLLKYRGVRGGCASLIFDGIEQLPAQVHISLLRALHGLRNASALDPNLDNVNLILTCNVGIVDKRVLLDPSSASSYYTPQSIRTENLLQPQLVALVEARLPKTVALRERNEILDHLEIRFNGHPWLTQCWLNAWIGADPSERMQLDEMDKKVENFFLHPKTGICPGSEVPAELRAALDAVLKNPDHNAPFILLDELEPDLVTELEEEGVGRIVVGGRTVSANTSWLKDTGLFRPGEDDPKINYRCTNWVATTLGRCQLYKQIQ